jgi:succinate dehydrogenase/fumarate reductase flavoprotein subunit
MRGPHDIGGLPGGPVETQAHEVAFWEKEIDALRGLIGAKGIVRTDENRRYIEELGHDAYDRLSYYERWTAALSRQMVDRGILTQVEIDARVADLRRRLAEAGELELEPGEAEKR